MQGEWDIDLIKLTLENNGFSYEEKSIPYGTQFRVKNGPIINYWETKGTVTIQGADSETRRRIEALFLDDGGTAAAEAEVAIEADVSNKVFIVYGHDAEAREQLELILRRLKLEPVVLQNLPSGGDTIIEKLERTSDVPYACVLLTPDDEGHPAGSVKEKKFRARQNVVLEMGMFLAKLGRSKVAILHKGNVELPSDIQGLIWIPFKNRVDEGKDRLAAELQEAGFRINIKDLLS